MATRGRCFPACPGAVAGGIGAGRIARQCDGQSVVGGAVRSDGTANGEARGAFHAVGRANGGRGGVLHAIEQTNGRRVGRRQAAAQPMGGERGVSPGNGAPSARRVSVWRRSRRAVAMPECPELHLAGRYINETCGGLVFEGGVQRSAVGRGPEVPFSSEAYKVTAASRGKELRLTLEPLGPGPSQALVFRFGMSGSFRLCEASSPPRHAHLRFFTRESPPRALCFVDPRRFGTWRLGEAWQPDRGPCVLLEYPAFR